MRIPNSVTIAKNGDLYFTDSDSDNKINRIFQSFLVNPNGRLFHLNRATKTVKVLIDNLWFANGVALSPNEDFVIVSDFVRGRILRYWLLTNKAGTYDVLADGLPGTPDNLSADKNGFWVAFPITFDAENPFIFHSLANFPLVRKFISRTLVLTEKLFNFINKYYPTEITKSFERNVNSVGTYDFLFHSRASIVRFDWNGKIVASYHANDGSFYTHVLDMNGKLYLGSFSHDYIALVKRRNHI
jgi:adipocyte plasma membrane-associated protein